MRARESVLYSCDSWVCVGELLMFEDVHADVVRTLMSFDGVDDYVMYVLMMVMIMVMSLMV